MDGSEVIDDDMIGPILEDHTLQYGHSSGSSHSAISREPAAGDAMKKKKKKGSDLLPGIVLSLSNRRKGAPHRAPLS